MNDEITSAAGESTKQLFERVHHWLDGQFLGGDLNYVAALALVTVGTVAAAIVVHMLTEAVVMGLAKRISSRTRLQWDNFLIERKFFNRLCHLAPASVLYLASESGLFPPSWPEVLERLSLSYVIVVGMMLCTSFLNVLVDIYDTLEVSKSNPIKGFVQGAKLFVYVVGGIFLIATLLNQDPWGMVASIGAVTAVLLLVFKDTILGLVASIQIIANDMVHLGDWIEMPAHGADGDVIDISLTTIKVQNWDKTISTIPTYALISESFKNWRGMQQSGGRRIKRSIAIDMTSVGFLTENMLTRFSNFELLADYILDRRKEVAEYNITHNIDTSEVINGRRLTNLGTFRAYVKAYLTHHPKIHQQMTFLVRQLPPGENGLPLEIYVFSNDQVWANYEEIQSDIFDHILSVIPEFGLRVFQNPTGEDWRRASAA